MLYSGLSALSDKEIRKIMRIVGGQFRGKNLLSPDGMETRPTSDRAREAIFNILHHAKWRKSDLLENAAVMDVFAGTGALGLEALSQGAAHGIFIEQSAAAAKTCQSNIDAMKLGDRTILMRSDALKLAQRPATVAPRSLVFLDPPYGKGLGAAALTALADKDWLEPGAVCLLEMAKKQPEMPPAGFAQLDERSYGVALVRFFEFAP